MRWAGALVLLAFAVVLPIPNAGAVVYAIPCLNEDGETVTCPERPPAVSGAPAREALAIHDAGVLDSDRVIDLHLGEFIVVRRPWIDGNFCSSAVERRRYYESNIGGEERGVEYANVVYVHARLDERACRAAMEGFDEESVSHQAFARDVDQLRCTEPSAGTCFNALDELRAFASRQSEWTNVFFEWRGRYLPWQGEGAHPAQGPFGRQFTHFVAAMRNPIVDPRDAQTGFDCTRAFEVDMFNDEAPAVTMCTVRSFEAETTYISYRQAPIY